jgi:predicted AAA+ superfamily ATPase
MQRRHWLASFATFILFAGFSTAGISTARAQQEEVSLTDRLRAGLKCRRPEEVEFVEAVVALVDQQKLSKELVFSTYQWAVRQKPDFPFYYFQYGIKRRAAAEGVDIP